MVWCLGFTCSRIAVRSGGGFGLAWWIGLRLARASSSGFDAGRVRFPAGGGADADGVAGADAVHVIGLCGVFRVPGAPALGGRRVCPGEVGSGGRVLDLFGSAVACGGRAGGGPQAGEGSRGSAAGGVVGVGLADAVGLADGGRVGPGRPGDGDAGGVEAAYWIGADDGVLAGGGRRDRWSAEHGGAVLGVLGGELGDGPFGLGVVAGPARPYDEVQVIRVLRSGVVDAVRDPRRGAADGTDVVGDRRGGEADGNVCVPGAGTAASECIGRSRRRRRPTGSGTPYGWRRG